MYGRIQKHLAKIAIGDESGVFGTTGQAYKYLESEIANYSNLSETDKEDLDEAIWLEAGWYLECIADGTDAREGQNDFIALIDRTGYAAIAGRSTNELINELRNEEVAR